MSSGCYDDAADDRALQLLAYCPASSILGLAGRKNSGPDGLVPCRTQLVSLDTGCLSIKGRPLLAPSSSAYYCAFGGTQLL